MLEGLEKIKWSELTHAYGSAADIPKLLHQRASDNVDEAHDAENEMFGNILHQGTVYPATSFAVPFLVELLRRNATHERYGLIILLRGIARGTGYYHVHGSFTTTQKAFGDENIAERLAEEAIYVPRARATVAEYTYEFINLLNDTDEKVRCHIPALLSALPNAHEWLRNNALKLASEASDPVLATNLLFALSSVVKDRPEWAHKATTTKFPDYPMAYVAIAHIVLLSGDTNYAKEASEIAVRPLLTPDEYENYFGQYYFENTDTFEQFWKLITQTPEATRPAMLATLCELMPTLKDDEAASIADDLLFWVFDTNSIPTKYEELSSEQRLILKQIDRRKNTVHVDADYRKVFYELEKRGILKQLGIQPRKRGW